MTSKLDLLWATACKDKQVAEQELHGALQALMQEEKAADGIAESVTERVLLAMEELRDALLTWQAIEPLIEEEAPA